MTAATNLLPSAEEATHDQFVLGAVVCVQLWAGNWLTAADRPPRAATRIDRWFIAGSLNSSLPKLNSLCAMVHNIRAASIIILIFVLFCFCQGLSPGAWLRYGDAKR